jgi:hypothetical protein
MTQSKMAGNAGLWRNAAGCIERSEPIDGKDHRLYIWIVTETLLFLQKLEDVWAKTDSASSIQMRPPIHPINLNLENVFTCNTS